LERRNELNCTDERQFLLPLEVGSDSVDQVARKETVQPTQESGSKDLPQIDVDVDEDVEHVYSNGVVNWNQAAKYIKA
jgi:hypothetical protein